MANQAAPLRNFSLNTPGNRVAISGKVNASISGTVLVVATEQSTQIPAPRGNTIGSGGGGGGGVVTYSTPITG